MMPVVERIEQAFALVPLEEALRECAAWLGELSNTELAALLYDWERFWARPEQIFPERFRSHGFLSARRFGKTVACSSYVNREVFAGRAQRIGFMAQNEQRTFEVQVDGEVGLIACSPPWFKARWERGRVVWPNGAQAFAFTPETPGTIRGPGLDLFWASEIQSWPRATREDSWFNAQLMTSSGRAQTIWDATPKRRHPILRMLLERAHSEPDRHGVVRGSIWGNASNLGEDVIRDLEADMGGTQRGREELGGEWLEDSEHALWKQAWINAARKRGASAPARYARRIIAIDPATSVREGTDATGIIELGLDGGGQLFVLADRSARETAETWVPREIARYFETHCDCIVAERSSGDLVTSLLRAYGKLIGVSVLVLPEKSGHVRHVPGVIHVREPIARAYVGKEERAVPVAGLYERGRVAHDPNADLEELETELVTWEPETKGDSPNRLDALVHGCRELAGLGDNKPDRRGGFAGLAEANKRLQQPARGGNLGGLMVRGGRGGRTI
jgi:phage terminase large subunit-like protein